MQHRFVSLMGYSSLVKRCLNHVWNCFRVSRNSANAHSVKSWNIYNLEFIFFQLKLFKYNIELVCKSTISRYIQFLIYLTYEKNFFFFRIYCLKFWWYRTLNISGALTTEPFQTKSRLFKYHVCVWPRFYELVLFFSRFKMIFLM